jgi:hypothetical protein
VGMSLDLLAPLAGSPTGFAVVAALGAACKTICGMTAGATRASITAHFALDGNLADVSAKEGAQETAVTLLGLVCGSLLASRMGDSFATSCIACASPRLRRCPTSSLHPSSPLLTAACALCVLQLRRAHAAPRLGQRQGRRLLEL